MLKEFSGPFIPPHSGKPPRHLVLMFHGYGATGEDLAALAQVWSPSFPDTAWLTPHAPTPCAMNPSGRQWFELLRDDAGNVDRGPVGQAHRSGQMENMAESFSQSLEHICRKHDVPVESCVLGGFSQGAMLALYMGLYHCNVAGILGYSGMLCPHSHNIKPKNVPVLLVHGDADDVVPFACLTQAQQTLEAHNVPVTTQICQGLEHTIDSEGVRVGESFLQKLFSTTSLGGQS